VRAVRCVDLRLFRSPHRQDGIAFSEENSEEAVISTMAGIPSGSRNRVVAEALVRNLHRFVKDCEPSNEEWEEAMDFLVKLSQWSHEPAKRHELMLVSDTLGVTMLVDCINHRKMDPRATEWTVQGPFHGARELSRHPPPAISCHAHPRRAR
jgi:hypothetical protein